MKEFELWLDESGDFMPQSQTDMRHSPSLVGGILSRKGSIQQADLSAIVSQGIIDPYDAHGMNFTNALKRQIILPALEVVVSRGARLVYFENRERIANDSHRELYLRLLASGITQLTQMLAAAYGEISLYIVIAEKGIPQYDLTAEEVADHPVSPGYHTALLHEQEIRSELEHYIHEEWREGRFDTQSRCRLSFDIRDARNDLRLKLADYASNARLTRRSAAFSGEWHNRLAALFDDEYFFSAYVVTAENEINLLLAAGNLGTALSRLYLARGITNHAELLERILHRFRIASYRVGKLQLRQFTDDIVAYSAYETDFEEVEGTLRQILAELLHTDHRSAVAYQDDQCEYRLRLALSDMYLREGDLLAARDELSLLRKVVSQMNYRLEHLPYLYGYIDKQALYYINCMEYQKAIDTISQSVDAIEQLQVQVLENEYLARFYEPGGALIGQREGTLHSECLGDALCMKIYAEMFLMRSHPEIYERVVADTEEALAQYEYQGELERNQQYRAHIEMSHGDYRTALLWLLRTCGVELQPAEDIIPRCMQYLEKAMTEDPLSRTYYLMYYVELLYEAERGGVSAFADSMYEAIIRSAAVYRFFFTNANGTEYHAAQGNSVISGDVIDNATHDETQLYHPVEIVWWKWGAYLCRRQIDQEKGMRFLSQSVRMCNQRTNQSRYLTVQVIGLGVLLEQISLCISEWMMNSNSPRRRELTKDVRRMISDLSNNSQQLNQIKAPGAMGDYIEQVYLYANRLLDTESYTEQIRAGADDLSRMVAY